MSYKVNEYKNETLKDMKASGNKRILFRYLANNYDIRNYPRKKTVGL